MTTRFLRKRTRTSDQIMPPCCGQCDSTPDSCCGGCGRNYEEVRGWRFLPNPVRRDVVNRCHEQGFITDDFVLSRYPWLTEEEEVDGTD